MLNENSTDAVGFIAAFSEAAYDGAIHFGWAPMDNSGLTNLLAQVQKTRSSKLRNVAICTGTRADLEDLHANLDGARVDGAHGWFHRCDEINAFVMRLRGEDDVEIDDVPVKRARRSRGVNKRAVKSKPQRRGRQAA